MQLYLLFHNNKAEPVCLLVFGYLIYLKHLFKSLIVFLLNFSFRFIEVFVTFHMRALCLVYILQPFSLLPGLLFHCFNVFDE